MSQTGTSMRSLYRSAIALRRMLVRIIVTIRDLLLIHIWLIRQELHIALKEMLVHLAGPDVEKIAVRITAKSAIVGTIVKNVMNPLTGQEHRSG